MQPVTAYLGLGSNLGNREENLRKGLRLIGGLLELVSVSSIYETEPWGYTDQPKFLNLACQVRMTMTAQELFTAATQVEQEVGRRPTFHYGPRVLDIDVLFYGDEQIATPELTVPHPSMPERAFVLMPMAEIAPSHVHPGLKRTVTELLERVAGVDGVRLWSAPV